MIWLFVSPVLDTLLPHLGPLQDSLRPVALNLPFTSPGALVEQSVPGSPTLEILIYNWPGVGVGVQALIILQASQVRG